MESSKKLCLVLFKQQQKKTFVFLSFSGDILSEVKIFFSASLFAENTAPWMFTF